MRMLKVVQINLKHSRNATDNLRVLLAEEDLDLGIIQEPWIHESQVKGFQNSSYKVIYVKDKGRIRSCLLAKKHIDIFLCTQLSTADLTVAKVELAGGRHFYLASCYMAHDRSSPPEEVELLLSSIARENTIILGCDANARHTIWGSSEVNDRGESLLDFINANSFTICNSGTDPTFIFPSSENCAGWENVLDLTLVSDRTSNAVGNWRVSKKISFSDHNWILFNIDMHSQDRISFRNPRRTDWAKFNTVLRSRLGKEPVVANSTAGLENSVGKLEKAIDVAFKVSCPLTRAKSYPPWWSKELSELRRETRQAFNVSYGSKSWQPYRDKLRAYKKAISVAKRDSWKEFCQSIDNTRDTARLSKVLAKGHSNPAYIKRDDGSWSESSEESLNILLDTHFPGSESSILDESATTLNPSDCGRDIITPERLAWAIGSFSPYKSPSLDGIIPKMLQSGQDMIIPWLVKIYRLCLSFNYVPHSWRKVKVVFIPKIGKRGHECAKDFRPISLSSFLLKIDAHIRQRLEGSGRLSYLRGRSTETALHEVVGVVERSLEYKQFTLGAFLDIEGAFNNVRTSAINDALVNLGVESYLSDWIVTMLGTRNVSASLGNSELSRSVRRGTPQGGVISPLLWLLVIDSVLVELDKRGVKVVAYADDVVILVSGMFLDIISDIMTNALNSLSVWPTHSGIGVNPSKTELVLFTRKTKIPAFRLPRLQGCELPLSDRAKYLGIILDAKLSWNLNIEHRVKKATVAFYTCRKMFGSKWGLSPKMVLWMYTAIVRPILTYGSLVWWTATDKGFVRTKLYRVQRSACIGVTGALRSTCPSEALNTMLHTIPIDLHIRAVASCSAVRLSAVGSWSSRPYGHARILNHLPPHLRGRSDYLTPRMDFEKLFKVRFPSRQEWDRGGVVGVFDIEVFTDGSKMDCGVGSGIYSARAGIEEFFRLPDDASVFQAEVLALREACRSLLEMGIRGTIGIFVDSQAALLSLDSHLTTSTLVGQCKDELSKLGCLATITLIWIPGHRDFYGNERADELARTGSALDVSAAVSVATPLGTIKRGISEHYLGKARCRWDTISTCRVTRQTWPKYDIKRTNCLLSRGRRNISRLTAVLTGHWKIGRHAERLGLQYNSCCRSCQTPGEEESVYHYLCDCEALCGSRYRTLGKHLLDEIAEISVIGLTDLVRFLDITGWV